MDIIQISDQFPTELSCVEYLESLRWGAMQKCAFCDSQNLFARTTDYRRRCKECLKTSSVTTNTLIHDSRVPIKKWLYAVSIIIGAKKGLSAMQLHRNLKVSYPTAFAMYHKIRETMMDANTKVDKLDGIVEMDETFIGGRPRKQSDYTIIAEKREELDAKLKEYTDKGFDFTPKGRNQSKVQPKAKRGRGTKNIPVVGIVERSGNVVAEVMQTLSFANLKAMVKKHVKTKSSVLVTDSYAGYNRMKEIIDHVKIDHHKIYGYKGINSNSIESFWAIVERGIMGQYHSVSPKKLPNYVAEFVYKYNHRKDVSIMFEQILTSLLRTIGVDNGLKTKVIKKKKTALD